jgi:epoxyqueuosine reductase
MPTSLIKERAHDLGFDLAGIAPIAVWKDLEFSRRWVEKGFHGEMRYLENPKRFDPHVVLPSAKSVICVGLVYNAPLRSQKSEVRNQNEQPLGGGLPKSGDSSVFPGSRCDGQRATHNGQPPPRVWISRYAWGQDYHAIMRAKLERLRAAVEELAPCVETRAFVDTGPVVERAFARLSGIGWMGKNTCIINQEKGSWFFLGVILTSLELAPDLPAPDRCGSCTACLEACPTEALIEPYVMDASRCISYFTIEVKGAIPEQFRAKIGANIFGCDICQEVCPWNASRPLSVASRQPSATSYPQASSHQEQPSDRPYIAHPATTKFPQFHPMNVTTIQPKPEAGGVLRQLTTDHGQRTTDHGQRTTDHGQRTTGQGQRAIDNAQDTADNGPRTTDNGRRTTDHGQRTTNTTSFSLFNPPLDLLALITEDGFRRIFATSPIKRAKYCGWLRNLCVAMGNSGDERFVPWLEQAARHPDPIVREHAAWALARLWKK